MQNEGSMQKNSSMQSEGKIILTQTDNLVALKKSTWEISEL